MIARHWALITLSLLIGLFLSPGTTLGFQIGNDSNATDSLIVSSPAFAEGDELPTQFTGDGAGQSPPVTWTQGPPETQCYALNLWHTPGPGDVKSYWLLYDIPAETTSLPQGARGIGTAGYNDKGRKEYDPMKSKGPGVKQYHITVFALSQPPEFSTTQVTREELLQSIASITLAQGTLDFQFTRSQDYLRLSVIAAVLVLVAGAVIWSLKKNRAEPGTE